ncbi:pancreatic progenitor cell differentiation and proliferation factor [Protopterus annectens]|uniref:pancreatic progenitor cell differentiation and proliferation factor n=1 Tax=Protopterus annectens TaxID=7888 RepID=UPI001CF95019|nr:pancreatic progenitor cell differentiation and proliferation factor [Protopterus annectens]
MASVPSGGSYTAAHEYYRRRLGSSSSNSSCGSNEYMGEVIPHHPSLPKSDSSHWWTSFFFGKNSLPHMATVVESTENPRTMTSENSKINCSLAQEILRKRHLSEPTKTTQASSP